MPTDADAMRRYLARKRAGHQDGDGYLACPACGQVCRARVNRLRGLSPIDPQGGSHAAVCPAIERRPARARVQCLLHHRPLRHARRRACRAVRQRRRLRADRALRR